MSDDEPHMLQSICDTIKYWDPDIILSYDSLAGGLQWLVNRGAELNIADMLSRWKSQGININGDVFVAGRVTLNLWKAMREEFTLRDYSFEQVAHHVLGQSLPVLRNFCDTSIHHFIDLLVERTLAVVDVVYKTDLIYRTGYFAILFGTDFESVLTRGSQFKVESMLLRMVKREDFVIPSNKIDSMKAMEAQPLVMEPESQIYSDPVVVLDFQSLYPSIMAAHNYCYSTCVGYPGMQVLGTRSFEYKEQTDTFISPNNLHFSSKRQGILSRMSLELIQTRAAIKQEMKHEKSGNRKRMLDAIQLGIKFISNVTYGYTAAGFSGRMPCAELADAVVFTGRQMLSTVISTIHSNPQWNSRVIYGDTDSVFILMENYSLADAHKLGNYIADYVTAMFKPPIKLKYEKIYRPCALETKKRYCGFKYESPNDSPVLESKGIETVRRDQCHASSKILESTIKTMDLNLVKNHIFAELHKLFSDRVCIYDYIFFKMIRPGKYKVLPAHAHVVEQRQEIVQKYQSIPFLYVHNTSKKLIDRALHAEDYFKSPELVDKEYYIERQILPTLTRFLHLIPGVDVNRWYNSMPKVANRVQYHVSTFAKGKIRLDEWTRRATCLFCRRKTMHLICGYCLEKDLSLCVYKLMVYKQQVSRQCSALYRLVGENCWRGQWFEREDLLADGCDCFDFLNTCGDLHCPLKWVDHALKKKMTFIRNLVDPFLNELQDKYE